MCENLEGFLIRRNCEMIIAFPIAFYFVFNYIEDSKTFFLNVYFINKRRFGDLRHLQVVNRITIIINYKL